MEDSLELQGVGGVGQAVWEDSSKLVSDCSA